ncbi:hypothetical protein BESB_052460 [Besnoitia besnoiti]|uniref:Transmembrane protein n=1 Tax=Besnoitia besnoiti TaxID=94643 RepID=A0A2A9MC91_BESBE|nr:hypothetical protein BESB_052460 [Besnoitia besnoiti]PFH35595.1 hypothetical protein BESB_052460 [Besnoitia besnoiti]
MPVPMRPTRRVPSRRRHGDSSDEDLPPADSSSRPSAPDNHVRVEWSSSTEDEEDDSDEGVHDPASRTDLYPARTRHKLPALDQLRSDVVTARDAVASRRLAVARLAHGQSGASAPSRRAGGGGQHLSNSDAENYAPGGHPRQAERSPPPQQPTALHWPQKPSGGRRSADAHSEWSASPMGELSREVSPGHVCGRGADSDSLPGRGAFDTVRSVQFGSVSSVGSSGDFRVIGDQPVLVTSPSRHSLRGGWGPSRDMHQYVVRRVSEELCTEEYGEDNSRRLTCCGCMPLIFTRNGWKMLFSVFSQENNFDLLLRNYVPEAPSSRQYTSSPSNIEDAGPPSNTMYSAGMALSQRGGRLMQVGTVAAQYAGRVEQFSKEPTPAVKHKSAMYRILKGYPFVRFRYLPLNHAYDYVLSEVVPVKLIWAVLFALIFQGLLTLCQVWVAQQNPTLLVDAVIRAGVCSAYFLFVFIVSLFARFRSQTELAVTALSAFFFLFCCIFESWQMITARTPSPDTPLTGPSGTVSSLDLIQEYNNLLEFLVVVLLTASSIRTSLLFYVHAAAILNVVFTCAVKTAVTPDPLRRISAVTGEYCIFCSIFVLMYMGYYREVSHRMAFYSWYCAKYKVSPVAGARRLASMSTMCRQRGGTSVEDCSHGKLLGSPAALLKTNDSCACDCSTFVRSTANANNLGVVAVEYERFPAAQEWLPFVALRRVRHVLLKCGRHSAPYTVAPNVSRFALGHEKLRVPPTSFLLNVEADDGGQQLPQRATRQSLGNGQPATVS